MVNVMSKRFDPAEHLTKQGWKGKGTALKNGHLTRPLAVVQKKTLSGVGKDRDEAVPFWDQIFASTAASLSLPSTPHLSPSPSGSPLPSTPTPRLADPRLNKSSSWQTSGSSPGPSSSSKGQSGLSVNVRISKESARRGLYSRFLRGKVELPVEGEEESEVEVEQEILGSGASTPAVSGLSTIVIPTMVKETKEEKKARRAEKAQRKAEKELRRMEKDKRWAEKVEPLQPVGEDSSPLPGSLEVSDGSKVKKRKKDKSSVDEKQADEASAYQEGIVEEEQKKKKKKRRKEEETAS